jgi:hypothetical protein
MGPEVALALARALASATGRKVVVVVPMGGLAPVRLHVEPDGAVREVPEVGRTVVSA